MTEYSRESEARAIGRGCRRLPGGLLTPDGDDALRNLSTKGYAPSLRAIIERALIEADAANEATPPPEVFKGTRARLNALSIHGGSK